MSEIKGFLRYILLSFVALFASLIFWKLLVTYLGDFAIILYKYEIMLIPIFLLFVLYISALTFHLELKKLLLYPFKLVRHKFQESKDREEKAH